MALKITRKYCTLGGCIGLASKTVNWRTYSGNATCYFGRVCDCYWEWPWPWQWSEQWLPLQVSRMATALWPWPWLALIAHHLDLRSDTKHCFPNYKWQIYTKGPLPWTVTDTVAYTLLDYCNLKAYNLIHRCVPCHNPPAVPSWPWCNGLH